MANTKGNKVTGNKANTVKEIKEMAKANSVKGNKNTKVTKEVKETKAMAKETKVYTMEIKATADEISKVKDMLKEMKLVAKEITVSESQGKTKAAKASKPAMEVTEDKANDKFDRKKYLEIGEKLGVKYISKKNGEEKVYGFARKIVYKAMEEKTLTAAKVKAYKDEIVKIAMANPKIQRYFKVA